MKRTELLHRVLSHCYCRLQPSDIHGIGVFAVRDIPRRKNPFLTMPRYAQPGFVRITDSELQNLPPELSETIRALFIPTDGVLHIPTSGTNVVNIAAYLNHSTTPNLRTSDGFDFIAGRKIFAGEELTVDYRTYGADQLLPE
jgi:SET domain-containing protein